MRLRDWVGAAVEAVERWETTYGTSEPHPSLDVADPAVAAAFDRLTARLHDNYPYFSPRYAGQMLKPPHPAAVLGYLTAMQINPNNHALDGGPATAAMEREVVADLARMFGYGTHLGHLTSSGTIANLEALYVARETHPGRGVAFSTDAHYTHARMCGVLGVTGHLVGVDAAGRLDVDALEPLLRTGQVGTVVVTTGTTGLGAVDPLADVVPLAREHGVRVHVDAAYGGFFRLLADGAPDGVARRHFAAIADADSVVVDPHKHGLQPYGCGAVLFADPSIGRFYRHDSPYTYFTSGSTPDDLHLGEISLECSRSGASAAALWLTLQLLPLTPDGLGAVLRPGRRAALRWAELLRSSERYALYQEPELDIVTYLPRATTMTGLDTASQRVFAAGMSAPPQDAVFVATYGADAAALAVRGHALEPDAPSARILRSVLMKPESEAWADRLVARLEELAAAHA